MFILAVSGLTWLVPSSGRAQLPELVSLTAQYLPSVDLQEVSPAEVQLSTYELSLNAPIPISDKTFLIPGVSYRVDSVSFQRAPQELNQIRAFHSVELAALFVQLLPRDWSLSLRVAPGLAGDFETVDSSMVRFSFLAMATQALSEKWVLGGGLLGAYSFGVFLPLPALFLEWKPHPSFRIETFIPAFLHATYTWNNRLEIGARAEVSGNSYAIRDESVRSSPLCTGVDRSACLDNVAYSTAQAGAHFGVRLVGDLWLSLYGGHTLFRRLEQRNPDGREISDVTNSLPNGFFMRAGLAWRLPQAAPEPEKPEP